MSNTVAHSDMKIRAIPLVLLALLILTALGSLYYYFKSDHRLARFLTSENWESYTVTDIASTEVPGLEQLKKLTEDSQMLFFPNQAYSRVTRMTMINQNQTQLHLAITESGHWAISGGYLQIRPNHFTEMKTGDEEAFSTEQITSIYQYFQINAEQSNRVDILGTKSVLLTGLNTRSQVLNAVP